MNFPDSPNVGQVFTRGDYAWTYIGNNKWDLLWVRGRGNLLAWLQVYIQFLGAGNGGTRGTRYFTFDAT